MFRRASLPVNIIIDVKGNFVVFLYIEIKILNHVIYMLVMFVVAGLIVNQGVVVIEDLKGMVRYVWSKPHLKFCSLTEPIQS
jgi:hypothetical protein